MVHSLQWKGAEEFKEKTLRGWKVSSKENSVGEKHAGQVKSHGGLTFLTVEGAGHMVCPLPCPKADR
jgi:carboxypeptidase C (cathepsin A)